MAALCEVHRAARSAVRAWMAPMDLQAPQTRCTARCVWATRHGTSDRSHSDRRSTTRSIESRSRTQSRVKILFLARHYTYFRNYESVIALLAARGHQIHLAAEREEDLGGRKMVERLAQQHRSVTWGWVPAREDAWGAFATRLRMTIDYLRYLDPAYAD